MYLGHEDVWHGYIDIVFSSHVGIPECIATAQVHQISSPTSSDAILPLDTPMKRPRTEGKQKCFVSLSH